MKTLVIGCETLKNELLAAIEKTKKSYDIVWIEARMHNVKTRLNCALQKILDTSEGYGRILFATGFCGNAISGLESRKAELIIPRVDDCTSLLCGSLSRKLSFLDSYFLTEGWLTGKQNIWNEYTYTIEKYGKTRAKRIFEIMFAHYNRIVLLDTGCYDIPSNFEKARQIADAFSLACEIIPASTEYLELLLTGPWEPARFLTIPAHTSIAPGELTQTY